MSEEEGSARSCPWCATPAAVADTNCRSCGAALAQRESIGDLRVTGLTSIDPALEDYASRPMHLRGPSPSHGVASGVMAAAALGGPAGLAIIGGVAAVAAAEYMGAASGGGARTSLADLGKPSEVVLQALERADATPPKPSTDTPASAGASEPPTSVSPRPQNDDGRSIWRDLPAPVSEVRGSDEQAMHDS